jgi:hypothetical protein
VFLRGVDPRQARPWDHPPARVEARAYQLHVVQGNADRRYGIVRRGDCVELTSAQRPFHSVQGRGAAFFARTFPEPGMTCTQHLDRPGVVELMSGAGAFWMRAYLFVDDHPYYALTAPDGRFALAQVPPGEYDLVCWLPDWREAGHELDGDTGLVWRVSFRPPRQTVRRVRVGPGQAQTAHFELSLEGGR